MKDAYSEVPVVEIIDQEVLYANFFSLPELQLRDSANTSDEFCRNDALTR